jgi:hypothetical protein
VEWAGIPRFGSFAGASPWRPRSILHSFYQISQRLEHGKPDQSYRFFSLVDQRELTLRPPGWSRLVFVQVRQRLLTSCRWGAISSGSMGAPAGRTLWSEGGRLLGSHHSGRVHLSWLPRVRVTCYRRTAASARIMFAMANPILTPMRNGSTLAVLRNRRGSAMATGEWGRCTGPGTRTISANLFGRQ